MKKILPIAILLTGCANDTPISETIADSAIGATTVLEQTLPEECKTEPIKTQLTVIKTQIRAITKACETEKDTITREKMKWKYSFWILIGIILAYVFKRMTK